MGSPVPSPRGLLLNRGHCRRPVLNRVAGPSDVSDGSDPVALVGETMSTFTKILGMATMAVAGATLGAAGGEFLFVGDKPPVPPRSICLLFDVSGSMSQRIRNKQDPIGLRTQLQALQDAAVGFAGRQDLHNDTLGLAVFSTSARVMTPLGHQTKEVCDAIGRLRADGSTDLAGGLDTARKMLDGAGGERWVLLFTDGKPEGIMPKRDPEQMALEAAARVRAEGIHIVAIGTGLADEVLLQRVTGAKENVFVSAPERLVEAFERSEQYIDSRQLLARSAQVADFRSGLERAAIWASLIAIGAGLGMVTWQNRHLRRRSLSAKDLFCVLFGGVLTGSLAGAAGQSLYWALSDHEWLGGAARTAAWVVLGLGCGLGMSLFVPNLNRKRAAAGGIVGGLVAAYLFVVVVPMHAVHGETLARLASAAGLGLFTAIALVLLEATNKKAWLVVHWSKKERSTLLLGATPIVVGHAKNAHIRPSYDPNGAPVLKRILYETNQVIVEEPGGRRQSVRDGTRLDFGRIAVEVRIAAADAAPPAPAVRTKPAVATPAATAKVAPAAAPARTPSPKPAVAPAGPGPARPKVPVGTPAGKR
jgi:Ca-activated chloride channel family protein